MLQSSLTKVSEPVKEQKRVRKKREKYLPKSEPLDLPFCKVCGKKASGIHFGVYSCEACKAFFRRYLQRKTPYKCVHGGKCDINEDQKGLNCSACRMKKCLDLGMSKDGIRQGRYTIAERTNVIIEMKKLQSKCSQSNCDERIQTEPDSPSSSAETSAPSSVNSTLDMCRDEEVKSPGSMESLSYDDNNGQMAGKSHLPNSSTSSESSTKFDGCLIEISEEVRKCACSESCTTMNIHPSTTQTVIDGVLRGLDELNPFSKTLSGEEIKARLKAGYQKYEEKTQLFGKMEPLSSEVYNEIYENTKLDVDGRREILMNHRGEMIKAIKEYVRFTHGIPSFRSLSPKDQSTLLKAARFDFFIILEYRAMDADMEMLMTYTGDVFHVTEACTYIPKEKMREWLEVTREVQKMNLSKTEHALLLAICLTFRDRCSLENPDKVEEIQTLLISTLRHHLQEIYTKDSLRHFSKIMDLLIKLRGLSEDFFRLYKELCNDKFLMETVPEMLQFLFDE